MEFNTFVDRMDVAFDRALDRGESLTDTVVAWFVGRSWTFPAFVAYTAAAAGFGFWMGR